MGQTATEEHIKRVVEEAVAAPDPSISEPQPVAEASQIEQAEGKDPVDVSGDSVGAEVQDDGVEDIGEDVEWKEPDVLASEVEWDDEVELLD